MSTKVLGVLMFFLAVGVLSCTAEPNSLAGVPDASGELAGFWMGLWHGLISYLTLFWSLFDTHVGFYETHNNGGWYNFGFIVGIGWSGTTIVVASAKARPRVSHSSRLPLKYR